MDTLQLMRAVLAGTGAAPSGDGELERWAEATDRLLSGTPESERPAALAELQRAWLWGRAIARLEEEDPAGWAGRLITGRLARQLGAGSLEHLFADAMRAAREGMTLTDPRAPLRTAAVHEMRLDRLDALTDQGLRDRLIADTASAASLLLTLRDTPPGPVGARVRRLFPELAALAVSVAPGMAVERDPPAAVAGSLLLLDHLADRALTKKLSGLERADAWLFQREDMPGLSQAVFAAEAARVRRLAEAGLLPCVRAALLHLDFAKGGDPSAREVWRAAYGADLSVHNAAARRILERAVPPGFDAPGVLNAFTLFRVRPALGRLALALVESHGLAGQAVRGETPLPLLAPFVRFLRAESAALSAALGVDPRRAAELAVDCLHVVNLVDTAAVREGLLTDALAARIAEVEGHVAAISRASPATDLRTIEDEAADHEDRLWRERLPDLPAPERTRRRLTDRLSRLRAGRIAGGEPPELTQRAVAELTDETAARLERLLRNCQFWYAEPATSALNPSTQLKVIALGLRAAEELPAVDQERPFHVNLQPLVDRLHPRPGDRSVPYRVRLVETMLDALTAEDLLTGRAALADNALGVFTTPIGGTTAVALSLQESPEAAALLTLLSIYEGKSSAAFHATLKTLCDLYGLRKDEFDRVANEGLYLTHMNSARSDKARMLDHARPGVIVEVGPGGGVVLDLLEGRYPDSRIIGIDASTMVVESLTRRKALENRRWEIVAADAFKLPECLGEAAADTVIFCSVLHEIYSYVEYPGDAPAPVSGAAVAAAGAEDGADPAEAAEAAERARREAARPRRFRRESVRDLLRAVWKTLRPGGRLIIRDGAMPPEPSAPRMLRFLVPEAREFFDLFARQFEGRTVRYAEAGPDVDGRPRVVLPAADAAEFLFKYNWGPESFPYEIREQYLVMPYDEYRACIEGWLHSDGEPPPRWVPLPPEERSYLQPGYRQGLEGKVELLDPDGRPCGLPDSNALWVFEKG